jgi:lipid-A-disaccharide synthase
VRRTVPEISLVVAGIAGLQYGGSEGFLVQRDSPQDVLAAADAGLCKSGTTTLEAVLADLPMVVSYRMHPWSHALARRCVRVRHVGLVNLVAGKTVAPELLQGSATPAALAAAVLPLLDGSGPAARIQRTAFAGIRAQLGTPGAGERVAEMAARLVA